MIRVRGFLVFAMCGLMGIGLLTGPSGWTQETKPKVEAKPTESKVKVRLPNYFAKIGLSEDQKTKIYGIREKHKLQIDKLEQELATLKERESDEMLTILNADQKKKLDEFKAAAAAKRKPSESEDDEEMAEPKKTPPKTTEKPATEKPAEVKK